MARLDKERGSHDDGEANACPLKDLKIAFPLQPPPASPIPLSSLSSLCDITKTNPNLDDLRL